MQGIRKLPNSSKKVLYLTFDDGPDQNSTPAVLDVLARHGVRATFFVVGEKAKNGPDLLKELQRQGHAIGNHSLDHGYSRFFRSSKILRAWIQSAEFDLEALIGKTSVGFRPPAGVITPRLYSVLRDLKIPLILWNVRFFDLAFKWSGHRALRSLRKAHSGDIILLHDCQPQKKLPLFLKTLDIYLASAIRAGFTFEILTRELTEK